MSYQKDIENSGWTVILLTAVGIGTISFWMNDLLWHLAHHMAWWTYALATTGGTFIWAFVSSIIKTIRKERRERRNRAHRQEATVLPSASTRIMGMRANGGSKPGHPSPWS